MQRTELTSCSAISRDFMLLPTIFNSSSNSMIFLSTTCKLHLIVCSV